MTTPSEVSARVRRRRLRRRRLILASTLRSGDRCAFLEVQRTAALPGNRKEKRIGTDSIPCWPAPAKAAAESCRTFPGKSRDAAPRLGGHGVETEPGRSLRTDRAASGRGCMHQQAVPLPLARLTYPYEDGCFKSCLLGRQTRASVRKGQKAPTVLCPCMHQHVQTHVGPRTPPEALVTLPADEAGMARLRAGNPALCGPDALLFERPPAGQETASAHRTEPQCSMCGGTGRYRFAVGVPSEVLCPCRRGVPLVRVR